MNAKGEVHDALSPVGGDGVSTLRRIRWRNSPIAQKQISPSKSRFSGRLTTGSGTYYNQGDVLREVLNNPEIEYVEVEGFPCSKRMLSEWAVKYLRHSILMETEEQSAQTESELAFSRDSGKMIECKPECAEASAETDDTYADYIQHVPGHNRSAVVRPEKTLLPRKSEIPHDDTYGRPNDLEFIIPHPGLCVMTTDKASGKKVFVNICKSILVGEPDLDYPDEQLANILANGPDEAVSDIPIPMSFGEMHDEYDTKGNPCLAVTVIINTKFFEERVLVSVVYRNFIVDVSIQGVNLQHRITLDKSKYTILGIRKSVGKLMPQRLRAQPRPHVQELKPSGSIDTNSSNSGRISLADRLKQMLAKEQAESQLQCDSDNLLRKRQPIVNKTEDKSAQTKSEPECRPVCADASTETDIVEDQNQSVDASTATAEASGTEQSVVQHQPAQDIPPLLGQHYLQNWSSYYHSYGQQPYTSNIATYQYQRYEAAKKWKPKDEEQEKALKLAKADIYNVLVVSKGCAMRNLKIGETLDLEKIGVPNLTTLLVQMEDMIKIKKERYTGEKYIYPNIGAEQFEEIAHIGELVAEQRDNQPMLNAAVQVDCHVADLFEYHQSTWYPHQTSFYSTAHHGPSQYPISYNPAYPNYAGPRLYYNHQSNFQYQYQNPSSRMNYQHQQYYTPSGSPQFQNQGSSPTSTCQQQQWLHLQLQQQTNYHSPNYKNPYRRY